MKAILFALLSLPLPLSSATTVPVGPGKITPAPGTAPWHTFDGRSAAGRESRRDSASLATFTTEDGLGANVVYLLYQDRAGHIWAGTSNGVSRYDGEKWINFTTASHGCWFPPCFPAYNEIERGDMRALERALQTRENEAKTPPARSTWSYR